MFKEFKEFIARGNVVDLAVAVVIGAAFGKIVTSLVERSGGVLIYKTISRFRLRRAQNVSAAVDAHAVSGWVQLVFDQADFPAIAI